MKGRKELRGRVSAMVNVAVTVSLTLASNPGEAADRRAERDAIGGTGLSAIGGTGIDAIGGTGRRSKGYTGDAIGGTGLYAIGGTGRTLKSAEHDAIGGTGLSAIGGTGIDAIGGTGRRSKGYTGDAIGGTGLYAIGGTDRKERVLVRGPVQRVNLSANSVTILGRDFRLAPDRTRLIHDALAGGQSVVLAISGELGRAGKLLLRKASIDQEQYVAGSSQVVLAGRVRSSDSFVGKVVIGRQVVDLTTAQTAAGGPSVKAGDVIVVVGTQPSLSGTISAQLVMQSD